MPSWSRPKWIMIGTVMATVIAGGIRAPAFAETKRLIVVTDQGGHQILVLDANPASWRRHRVIWRWRPTAANGLKRFASAWGQPDEARLRWRYSRPYLLTTDSNGFAAVIPYPKGRNPYWVANVGANPHSIELLPDGNVVVAASDGGWVRVYTASQRRRPQSFAEFRLTQAHAVLWDRFGGLLWAIGDRDLVALRVGGSPAQPRLSLVHRTKLPTSQGHDVEPVSRRPDRLWVTTAAHLYQYSKRTGAFLRDFPGARHINDDGIKSVGQDPATGRLLLAMMQPKNPCHWCTDSATLYGPRQILKYPGGEFYKIRWW